MIIDIYSHMGEEAWFEGISTAGEYSNIILDIGHHGQFQLVPHPELRH